jgi:hypothetical protein
VKKRSPRIIAMFASPINVHHDLVAHALSREEQMRRDNPWNRWRSAVTRH